MAYLEIETRDGIHRVQLERDRLSIGRLSYNDVVLPFAQISRQHAELRLISGQWWIADLHSTNGLLLDGQRIQEHCLSDGDQVTLAPGISFRFSGGGPAEAGAREASHGSSPDASAGSWAQRVREQFTPPAGSPQPFQPGSAVPQGRTWGPAPNVPPAAPHGPFVPPSSIGPMRPRSVYSDDEVPYVPPGMEPPQHMGRPDAAGAAGRGPAPGSGSNGGPFAPQSPSGAAAGSGGYPAPPGPFYAGADPHDLYMRDAPARDRQRNPSGPASKLLHVCQTCGQLTAPDAVYCQNCHHSITHECSNCRLSLLPIQERCPRCHTPNEASVRRAHPGRDEA